MLSQLAEFLSQPLMLESSYLARLSSISKMDEIAKINCPDPAMVARDQASAASKQPNKVTAVIPVQGFISPRDSWVVQMMGGTALDSLQQGIDICLNEPRIGGILFDFNTPGGSAFGVKGAADYIASVRDQKPMVSICRYMMCSAGYYLGAATSRIVAEPTSMIGSIGVVQDHFDESKALEKAGVTATVFRVPEYKGEGHPAEPLSDAAKANIQAKIEALYSDFVGDVADYRGITIDTVKNDYGKGRALSAKDALKSGMIDKIDSYANVCKMMASGTMARSLAQSGRMEGDIDTAVLMNQMSMLEIHQ